MDRSFLEMMEFTCIRCPGLKAEDAFELDGRYDPPRRKAVCRACVYARRRRRYREVGRKPQVARPAYYAARHRAHRLSIDELKQCPCVDCARRFPAPCMEFDHVQEGKSSDVSNMQNYKTERVAAEIALCELVCSNCHRVRTDNRRPARKTNGRREAFRTWIASLKEAPCKDCKECFPAVAMDFDHVHGVKICGIAQMWSWGRSKVLVELAKCELVCANCHRLRTISRQAAA